LSIFQVHFNSIDIKFVAGRKQLRKDAIPCHFCVCLYDKRANRKNQLKTQQNSTKQLEVTDHIYSMKPLETADHVHCSAKKFLFPPLTHTHLSEHNYFAHTGKENKRYFVKKVFDINKKLDLITGKSNAHVHVDHCPLLRKPIFMKQSRNESNIYMNQIKSDVNINQNGLDTDVNQNISDISSRQVLISKIDDLLKDNENLKLKLNQLCVTQINKISAQDAKLKKVIADNKVLKKQLEKLTQQTVRFSSSADEITQVNIWINQL